MLLALPTDRRLGPAAAGPPPSSTHALGPAAGADIPGRLAVQAEGHRAAVAGECSLAGGPAADRGSRVVAARRTLDDGRAVTIVGDADTDTALGRGRRRADIAGAEGARCKVEEDSQSTQLAPGIAMGDSWWAEASPRHNEEIGNAVDRMSCWIERCAVAAQAETRWTWCAAVARPDYWTD